MLGDKVEWQCKTKASAAHTVHWMKVRLISSSLPLMSVHGKVARFQEQRASANVCQQRICSFFSSFFSLCVFQHSQNKVFKTQTPSILNTAVPRGSIFGLQFFWLDFEACSFFVSCNSCLFDSHVRKCDPSCTAVWIGGLQSRSSYATGPTLSFTQLESWMQILPGGLVFESASYWNIPAHVPNCELTFLLPHFRGLHMRCIHLFHLIFCFVCKTHTWGSMVDYNVPS